MKKIKRLNKKGQTIMPLVIFIAMLFLILFVGFMMAVGSAILNFVFDTTVPAVSNLGSIGGANLTQAVELTIIPLDNLIQQFVWLTGVLYVLMLVGVMGIALVFKGSPDKWLIGFFLSLILLLILGAMFMSNIYENFYTGSNDLATRLQEHIILSYMILYSPVVFTVISFIAGIIFFSGRPEGGGGFV